MSTLTVKTLLEQLGFPSTQSDLDESLKWALVELSLRRAAEFEALDRAAQGLHNRAIVCRGCRQPWVWSLSPLPFCPSCRPDLHAQADAGLVEFNAAF